MYNNPILKSIIKLENLHWAWEKAKDFYNDDNYWCDELEITNFQVHYEKNLKEIQREILENKYKLSPLKPIFFPKTKGENGELKNRQMFWVSIKDQVVWLAVMNVIGKYYDKQMPFWSYGNRLYVNIYPNKKESKEEKIHWEYGPYRNTTKKTYRSFGQSWPRFRKDIYITSKMMVLQEDEYKEQFTEEENDDIKNNESLRELHRIKYKEKDYWGKKFGKDVYWCSLDLSKFYPNTPTNKILENFKLFGTEIKERFDDFDGLLLLLENLLSFEIDYKIGTNKPEFKKIGLSENEIKFNGIPTGLFGAGFLANIAMLGVDNSLNSIIKLNSKTKDKIAIFRYVDDFTILGQRFDAVLNIIDVINKTLNDEFKEKISLNFEKTKPDELQKYLLEKDNIALYEQASISMKLDANFPTALMNHTLKKVSTSNRIAFDLLDSDEEKKFIQDLEHLLVTDISEDEIRKDTRLSFASSKLSILVPQKKYDYTNIYESHCKIKGKEQQIHTNRQNEEVINLLLEELVSLNTELSVHKKYLEKEIAQDRKKVSGLLKFAIENYPDKLKLWKNLINFYKNIGFSKGSYLEMLNIFELLKKYKQNNLINEFTHEYLITYIYDVLTNAIFSSIKSYQSEYISHQDKLIKESFFNQMTEPKVFQTLNNPNDSAQYKSFYFIQSKKLLNIAISIGKYYFYKNKSVSLNLQLEQKEYCWLINKLNKKLVEPFIQQYFDLNIKNDLNIYDLYLISFYPEFNYENMKIYENDIDYYLSFPWWYNYLKQFILQSNTVKNVNSKNSFNLLKFQEEMEKDKNINIFSYIQNNEYTELEALEIIYKVIQNTTKLEFSFEDENSYEKLKKQFPYNIYIKNRKIEIINFKNINIIDKRYFPDFVDFDNDDFDRKFIYGVGILLYQMISKDLDLLPEMYQPSNQLLKAGYFIKELEKDHISTFSYEIIKACLSKKNRELINLSSENKDENEFDIDWEEIINISTLNELELYIKSAIKFLKDNQSKNSKRLLIPKKLFSLTSNFNNNHIKDIQDTLKIGFIQVNFNSDLTWGPESDITLHMKADVEDFVWQEIQKGFHKMVNHHTKPDIIILPELTVPHPYVQKLRKLASEINAVTFAGIDWFVDSYRREVQNKAVMIVPNHWNTTLNSFSSSIAYLGKNNPSNGEKKTIAYYDTKKPYKFKSDDNMYIIDSGKFGKIGFIICADFYDIERFVVYKGRVQHIIILALNRDTNSFFAISEAVARLVMCNVVICNTGQFGDSLAYSPYKDSVKRMIYRNQGANLFSTQVIALPVKSLIEDQKEGASIITTDKSNTFKMPPIYEYIP